jgi:NAD(P)-dependent dehydrogenase (short-subunit alcohol dehydrogenase family)
MSERVIPVTGALAGIGRATATAFAREGAYDAVFGTNVRGPFLSLKHELRVMTRQGFGSIVNLSSTFGERGGAGAALYSASKHAPSQTARS